MLYGIVWQLSWLVCNAVDNISLADFRQELLRFSLPRDKISFVN